MSRQKKINESDLVLHADRFLDVPEEQLIVSDITHEEIKVKTLGLFDHIKQIMQIQHKKYFENITDGDKKSWSNFMINRFLSMEIDFIELINETQKFTVGMQMKSEVMYKMLIDIIPKSKIYLNYIKSKNESKYDKELVDIVKLYYLVSAKHAIEYIDILHKTGKVHELKKLLEKYGYDESQVKKILV